MRPSGSDECAPDGILDTAAEYYLRKLFYRTVYYEADRGHPDSMRSGWSTAEAQREAYAAFLPYIERPGNLLDLGCGDGRLLAFLHEHARVPVTPYGVDFLEESIRAAQASVLPEFAANFAVSNIANFDAGAIRFAQVITNPFYLSLAERRDFLRRCSGWVEPGGSLLLYEYAGASGFEVLFEVCQQAELNDLTLYRSPRVMLVRCRP